MSAESWSPCDVCDSTRPPVSCGLFYPSEAAAYAALKDPAHPAHSTACQVWSKTELLHLQKVNESVPAFTRPDYWRAWWRVQDGEDWRDWCEGCMRSENQPPPF